MSNKLGLTLFSIMLTSGTAVYAQQPMQHMDHSMHMTAMAEDGRQTVNFPPAMRQHTLANMRDHLQALSEILGAIAGNQYAKAGEIAGARLGMNSPSAEGCKPAEANAPQMSKPASMEQQMAQFMPEGMNKIGLSMHEAASTFSTEAALASKTGDTKPALAALAVVTQQCAACHATYKVQ